MSDVQDRLDYLSMVCANPSDGLSAGLWCETANEGLLLARSLFEQLEAAMDCMNYAWTIICNVSEGDWTKQRQEWQDAAAKCREQYHALLDANQVRRIERAVITSTDQHGNPALLVEDSSPASRQEDA